MGSSFRRLAPMLATAVATACGGGNVASNLARAPEFAPKDQAKCGVMKSQARPLVVEWPASDRGALEALAKQGLVPVRYAGCEMEVLTRCRAPGTYGYTGITHKHDRIHIRDQDELYANVPIHAAQFEAKLSQAGELNVEMTIVGRYDADRPSVRADELRGECESATHVVTALTVGAFEFSAGADADLEGGASILGAAAGGRSKAAHETLARDGDDPACQAATGSDTSPPNGCGALIRLEVVPIAAALAPATATAPGCSPDTVWDGSQCVPGTPPALVTSPSPFVPMKIKSAPPGKLRFWHYGVGAVALGAIGVSVYSGIQALSDKSTVNANCNTARGFCDNQAGLDAAAATKSAAILSTVMLGVGVGGVIALPFIPLDRSQPPATKLGIAPAPGGGMGTLGGEF